MDTAKSPFKRLNQFTLTLARFSSALLPMVSPTEYTIKLLDFCQSDRWEVMSPDNLTCISLILSEAEQLFHAFKSQVYTFVVVSLLLCFYTFPIFCWDLGVFLYRFLEMLHILRRLSLFVMSSRFSYFAICLLTLAYGISWHTKVSESCSLFCQYSNEPERLFLFYIFLWFSFFYHFDTWPFLSWLSSQGSYGMNPVLFCSN